MLCVCVLCYLPMLARQHCFTWPGVVICILLLGTRCHTANVQSLDGNSKQIFKLLQNWPTPKGVTPAGFHWQRVPPIPLNIKVLIVFPTPSGKFEEYIPLYAISRHHLLYLDFSWYQVGINFAGFILEKLKVKGKFTGILQNAFHEVCTCSIINVLKIL